MRFIYYFPKHSRGFIHSLHIHTLMVVCLGATAALGLTFSLTATTATHHKNHNGSFIQYIWVEDMSCLRILIIE